MESKKGFFRGSIFFITFPLATVDLFVFDHQLWTLKIQPRNFNNSPLQKWRLEDEFSLLGIAYFVAGRSVKFPGCIHKTATHHGKNDPTIGNGMGTGVPLLRAPGEIGM